MTAAVAIELVTPLTLTGASTHFRQEFVEGDVPAGQYVIVDPADTSNAFVTPHNYWPDGSLRGARVALRADFAANIPKRINLVKRSSPGPTGTALTAATIAAGPNVVIGCGSYGSIALGAMSLLRTYVSNKECVTAIYAGNVGSDPYLWAEVEATAYADGNIKYDARINNCFVESALPYPTKTYTPTITVGGTVKYNNGGTAVTHYPFSAPVRATVWSGADPQIRPIHDTGYLLGAYVAPNYPEISSDATILSNLTASSTYTPGANLRYTPSMGDTGYQEQIGPMSTWDAYYFIFRAAKPAFDCVMAHARAINAYATVFASSATLDPINYTTHATWGMDGLGKTNNWATYGGGNQPATMTQDGATQLKYDDSHAPLASSWLAYVLTDSYLDLVTMVNLCRSHFLAVGSASGSGVNRNLGGQQRKRAWDTRTLGLTCAVLPDSLSSVFGDLKTHLTNVLTYDSDRYNAITGVAAQYGLIDVDGYGWVSNGYTQTPPIAATAMWQLDFYSNALGWLRKVKPISGTGLTKLQNLHAYLSRAQLFRSGTPGVSTEYNPGRAALYYHTFRVVANDGTSFTPGMIVSTDPGQVDQDSNGVTSNPSTITLAGTGAADPADGRDYWAQYLSALVWMEDLGVAGVAAKRAALKGATNWNTTQGATDKLATPNFNFATRAEYSQPLLYTATDSGAGATSMTTPGPSFVWDTATPFANSFVWGPLRGLGLPLSSLASGGSDGTTPLYDAYIAAGGTVSANSEVRWLAGAVSHGTLNTDPTNGAIDYTGDGTYDTSLFNFWLDGPSLQTAVPVNFGTAPAGGGGSTPTPTITATVRTPPLALLPNLTGLKWAMFSQATPDLFGAPVAKGATASTDGAAKLNIPATVAAGTYFLIFTTSDGTTTQNPPPQSFAAPITVA